MRRAIIRIDRLKGVIVDAAAARVLFEQHAIHTVKLGGSDLDGAYRGKRLPAEVFLQGAEQGFAQCDVIFGWDIAEDLVPNLRFTGWESGYPDIIALPDLSTLALVPWEPGVVSVICDFRMEDGSPVTISPRHVLQRVIARASAAGFDPFSALELEFRIFRETAASLRAKGWLNLEPLSPSNSCYSIWRSSVDDDVVGGLVRQLTAAGIPIEGYNREHGPGMYEVNMVYGPTLLAADRSMMFRDSIKQLCAQQGLTATFMAKWNDREDGCSGHIHQSLQQAGQNIFYDASSPHHLSPTLEHFTAGILATMPEFCALYAPNVNSYKRLVPGTWAPTTVTWGIETRTTSVRVVPGSSKSTRVETRTPGCDVNPYLGMAAALAAGLHGIEQQLPLPPRATGNAYELPPDVAPPLPRTLRDAVALFEQSALARDWFGADFVDHYVAMRRWDVAQYERVVTTWERERYFEMV